MAEAQYLKDPAVVDFTAAAALASGQVVQLPDGRAGVIAGLKAIASGDLAGARIVGQYKMAKTTSVVLLDGQLAYWVKSTNKVSYAGDYVVGVVRGDVTAAATTVLVDLNATQARVIDFPGKGLWTEVATLGLGSLVSEINGRKLVFDGTGEAAMAALYSVTTIPVAAGPIFEGNIAIYDIGNNAVLDFSFGLVNGTHATDMDSVTESVLFHLDGNDLDHLLESDDGTTEVNAITTTVDAVDDTYAFYQIDARDLASVKFYINGVRMLPGTTFVLSAATGPLHPILHIEKSGSDATLADLRVRDMWVRSGLTT